MNKMLKNNQAFMVFLISSVLACISSIMITSVGFDLLSHSLLNQILLLGVIWLLLAVVYFFCITRLSAHSKKIRMRLSLDLTFNLVIKKNFLAAFFLFPICTILYQNILELIRIFTGGSVFDSAWILSTTNTLNYFLVFVLVLFLLLLALIMKIKPDTKKHLDGLPDIYYVFIIFLVNMAIRLYFIYAVNTQPESDFLIIYNDAIRVSQGDFSLSIYTTTHIIVSLIYSVLFKLFGTKLIVVKIFHILVYGLSGVFIFYSGKQIFENKLWSWISGLLLVAWPSLAIYSNVLTPEHLFILVECALIFAISRYFRNERMIENKKFRVDKYMLIFLAIGFLLGLLGLFRPFNLLFLAAFMITLIVYSTGVKPVLINLLGLLVMLIPYLFLNTLRENVAKYYDNEIPNIRPCNFLVGLNIESSGQWNMDDYYLCRAFRLSARDETEYMANVLQTVLDRLRPRQKELFPFLNKKFSILWTNNYDIISWGTRSVYDGDQNFVLDVAQKISLTDLVMTFIVAIACLMGAVIAFFRDVKPTVFFCMVTFFGFNLMEIPFEVQARYRTAIMPLFIFFACWAFATLYDSLAKVNKRLILSTNDKMHRDRISI